VPARASLAQLDAATNHLSVATRGYRQIVSQRPLPQYVIALGEA